MQTLANGEFSIPITNLHEGLRKTDRNKKNVSSLISCQGAYSKDKTLRTIFTISQFDTDSIGGSFPYPQIFVFTNLIIGCNQTEIYELVDSAWVLKYTAVTGSTWTAQAFHDYVYMSNGVEAVERDPESKEYSNSSSLPTAMTICNFNGQLIIGSPNASYI